MKSNLLLLAAVEHNIMSNYKTTMVIITCGMMVEGCVYFLDCCKSSRKYPDGPIVKLTHLILSELGAYLGKMHEKCDISWRT